MNKAIIIGNLGGDPELKTLQSGNAVCNFSVATSKRWKDKQSGEQREKTEWHRIVAWGKTAELCNQYLRKGSKVCVEGSIETRSWDDRDGQKRYTTEIVADNVEFLSSRGDNGGGRREEPPPPSQPSHGGGHPNDDIPF